MEKTQKDLTLVWLRRDLRLKDNRALSEALKQSSQLQIVFFFDPEILENLEDPTDARVQFIHEKLQDLDKDLKDLGGRLWVFHEEPEDGFKRLFKEHQVATIFANEDYEPSAICRDVKIQKVCEAHQVEFHLLKDQVIFSKSEILTDKGTPYTVYGAYKRRWLKELQPEHLKAWPLPALRFKESLYRGNAPSFPSLADLGFKAQTKIKWPSSKFPKALIKTYDKTRDVPGEDGTSRLGLHLRFGTISIRELVSVAKELNSVFLSELIWREFFMQILFHFPKTENANFRSQFDKMPWRKSDKDFEAWCEGRTGVPIVDAGMRELNETGYMHNRVRMIVASYLTKHLLIDWRRGERYFARKLLDFELASNVGNWQWVAGSGCDAAPYFRVFNPDIQTKKFDPDLKYIKKWVPEWGSISYPKPLISHVEGRDRALQAYYSLSKK